MATKKTQRAGTGTSESTRGRHVSFEVLHNGSRVVRAAIPGFAVLSTHVTWVRRDKSRFDPDSKVEAEELLFSVGGLDSNDPTKSRHVDWTTPPLAVGDRVEIRVDDNPNVDPPSTERIDPKRERPEPPPRSDPSRFSVKDAVVWPAARDRVFIKAMDRRNVTDRAPTS